MNLIEFQNKISSDVHDNTVLSRTVTLCSLLNQNFDGNDVSSISVDKESKTFFVDMINEPCADRAVQLFSNAIVPGSFNPLFEISISRESCSLKIDLNEI